MYAVFVSESLCMLYIFPNIARVMIGILQTKDEYLWKALFVSFLLLFGNFFNGVVIHMSFKYGYVLSMRIRTSITTAVYRKVLITSFLNLIPSEI